MPDAILFIRGDSNVNKKNAHRVNLLNNLIKDFSLTRLELGHNAYHHFTGNGSSDSEIDVILFPSRNGINEEIQEIICKND